MRDKNLKAKIHKVLMNNTSDFDPLKINLHETSIDLMDNLKITSFFIDG